MGVFPFSEGGSKLKKETYDVTGMSCAACSSRVEKAVARQSGVQQVSVNLLKNSMVVEYDESALSSAQIVASSRRATAHRRTKSPVRQSPPRKAVNRAASAPRRRPTAA